MCEEIYLSTQLFFFSLERPLIRFNITNTGFIPYKCHICGKTFNHRSHLNVHLQTHTGEKPHKCHLCPKEFSRKTSLKQHLRTHGISDGNIATASSTITKPMGVDEDADSNFSDGSFLEGTHVDATNFQVLLSI